MEFAAKLPRTGEDDSYQGLLAELTRPRFWTARNPCKSTVLANGPDEEVRRGGVLHFFDSSLQAL